jgi:nucleoside-diphosphate-sugar epimerase
MKVLVTGTAGRVGSATAREFLRNGYDVRGLDCNAPAADLRERIEVVYADLTDRMAMLRAAEGCDAIAHLAAIPNPGHQDAILMQTNVTGTQYVLAAAEANGIERVALASTCCAFGIFFAHRRIDPQYLPMDEKHPDLPQDLYGLSKVLNEETARTYTRRTGMTTTCLRLTTVINLEQAAEHRPARFRDRLRRDGRENDLWSYIDLQDAARAFRLAIENAPKGSSETAIIAARDSLTRLDIRDLVRSHFPALVAGVEGFAPDASLYDTTHAEEAFGFVAQNQWRNLGAFTED